MNTKGRNATLLKRAAAPNSGFTLIEVLVALAIFSVAAISLIHVQAESAKSAAALRDRAIASIVAENIMVEHYIQAAGQIANQRAGVLEMAGDDWQWSISAVPTANPFIQRIDVEVGLQGGSTVLASVSGFRGVE